MTLVEITRIALRLGFRPGTAAILLAFYLGSTFFEALGLTMLVPVFQFVQRDGDVAALIAENRYWEYLVSVYRVAGVPITLATLLVAAFTCVLARTLFMYARVLYTAVVREKLLWSVRNLAFQRYLGTMSGYAEHELSGGMVNDLTTELDRLIYALFSIVTLAGLCLTLLLYVALLLALSLPTTIAAVVILGLAGASLRGLWRKTQSASYRVTDANQSMAGFLVERLKALRLIRLSGTEPAEAAVMGRLTGRQRDNMVRLAALMARLDVIVEPAVVALGLVFLYLAVGAFDLSLEEIGLFLVVVLRLLPVVKEALRTRQSMIGSIGSIWAVDNRLRAMEAAREPAGGRVEFARLAKAIRFDHVSFAYDDGAAPALDDISLEIPAGAVTAVVGPSGAGKSTLIDLLPRLRDPTAGRISFDGRPIEDFSLETLRRGIAYAPQSPQVFSVTIADHIRYGRPGASDADIREAARLAEADGFIGQLGDGYDTLLGEGGVGLSGGQRQRLDLSRALVRKAPILILDEPTSNLDADAEEAFRAALERIRRETDMTIIVVGHRLSTVAIADQIVIMEAGRVSDTGSPTELLARGGWYASALAKQPGPVNIGADPDPAEDVNWKKTNIGRAG
ncbi:MAG: ABC transporter ATP-binding protein [Alphaproteobacteria bacterium]|nr:ABC transporter ATP-binding protein [Alphaproteobacteria bacterium]